MRKSIALVALFCLLACCSQSAHAKCSFVFIQNSNDTVVINTNTKTITDGVGNVKQYNTMYINSSDAIGVWMRVNYIDGTSVVRRLLYSKTTMNGQQPTYISLTLIFQLEL